MRRARKVLTSQKSPKEAVILQVQEILVQTFSANESKINSKLIFFTVYDFKKIY